jgi:hypothetical protein
MKSSRTITTSFQTIGIPRGWAELGETTTQTIFKQRTGGVTKKKDQPEWTDLRPISRLLPGEAHIPLIAKKRCANSVPKLGSVTGSQLVTVAVGSLAARCVSVQCFEY